MESWTNARARLARASQTGDQDAADRARRDLKAARAEDYIRKLVDHAPPLSQAQRDRLAVILRSGRASGGDADAAA